MKTNLAIFIFFLILLVVVFVLKSIFQISDISTIAGVVIGVVGSLFSYWQIALAIEKEQNERLLRLKREILEELDEMRQAFDKRDFYHEQQINTLIQKLSELNANHSNHEKLIDQLLVVKDDLAYLRASFLSIGQQQEITLQLQKMRSELDEFKKTK